MRFSCFVYFCLFVCGLNFLVERGPKVDKTSSRDQVNGRGTNWLQKARANVRKHMSKTGKHETKIGPCADKVDSHFFYRYLEAKLVFFLWRIQW